MNLPQLFLSDCLVHTLRPHVHQGWLTASQVHPLNFYLVCWSAACSRQTETTVQLRCFSFQFAGHCDCFCFNSTRHHKVFLALAQTQSVPSSSEVVMVLLCLGDPGTQVPVMTVQPRTSGSSLCWTQCMCPVFLLEVFLKCVFGACNPLLVFSSLVQCKCTMGERIFQGLLFAFPKLGDSFDFWFPV